MTKKKLPNNMPTHVFCPKCREDGRGFVTLIVKSNRHNDNQFLGCPQWPDCDHTEEITEEMRMRLHGAPTLF